MLSENALSRRPVRNAYSSRFADPNSFAVTGLLECLSNPALMGSYDDILAKVVNRIQGLASERVTLERDNLRAVDVDEEDEWYRDQFVEQEQRFGLIVSELRALFFGNLNEIREQYDPKLKARAEYGARQLFASRQAREVHPGWSPA